MLSFPKLTQQNDTWVQIRFSSPVYKDWVKSGIARVDAFLEALGFSNIQQVRGFCLSKNALLIFSERGFFENYLGNSDRNQLTQNIFISSNFKYFPGFFSNSLVVGDENSRPDYSIFYLLLFSWLTHGENPQERQNYIKYCQENGTDSVVLTSLALKEMNAPVLQSFKNELDIYLNYFVRLQKSIPPQVSKFLTKSVADMTRQEKVAAAIWRSFPLLPAEVAEELKALLDPVALAIIVVVLVVWAVSHFFGVGEIADVIIIIVGIVSLGPIAWKAGEELIGFAMKSVYAKSEADLDQAAKHLAEAISLVGVQVVMTLLLKKAPKVFREPRNTMGTKFAKPYTTKTIGTPPETPGSIFYKPKTTILENPNPLGKSGGLTNQWGDIHLVVSKVANEAQAAKIHELVHRFLTPKLQMFPQLRQNLAVLKSNSYLKSYILRYMEEALAETVAQLSVNGISWRNLLVGIRFPLGKNGGTIYVSQAAMKTEAIGILLGPINVSGMVYNVYYAFSGN